MIKEKRLSNNMVVLYEKLTHVKSTSMGVFVKVGSVDEQKDERGISHFIEHMLFKGTAIRTAKDIAAEFDDIGGHVNAFTSKELTCYYAKTIDEHFPLSCEVLSDMIQNSLFEPKMIQREKDVVYEEIAMYNDSPDELVHDKLCEKMWKNHPLAHPIIGLRSTVNKFTQKKLQHFMKMHYHADNVLLSVVGNFDETDLLETLEKYFGSIQTQEATSTNSNIPVFRSCHHTYERSVEQAYISMAFESVGYDHKNRHPYMIISNILGGGMSSKLFQSIREEKGLAYHIGCMMESYKGAGILNIYAGTGPKKIDQLLDGIHIETKAMREKGISSDELNKAKEQVKGHLILGLENTDSRMFFIAKNRILRGENIDQEQLIQEMNGISLKQINQITQNTFDWDQKAVAILRVKNA